MTSRRSRTALRDAPAGRKFVVVCRRSYDGRERAWNSYDDRSEAERVAEHRKQIGCPSRVVVDDELPLERGAT